MESRKNHFYGVERSINRPWNRRHKTEKLDFQRFANRRGWCNKILIKSRCSISSCRNNFNGCQLAEFVSPALFAHQLYTFFFKFAEYFHRLPFTTCLFKVCAQFRKYGGISFKCDNKKVQNKWDFFIFDGGLTCKKRPQRQNTLNIWFLCMVHSLSTDQTIYFYFKSLW